MVEKSGKLVLSINNEIGLPIYNSSINLEAKNFKKVIKTNLCGLASSELVFGEYILTISANEYNTRRFKILFNETSSFLSITLKYLENIIYGHIIDSEKLNGKTNKVCLLYEITDGTFVKVKETDVDSNGKYKFNNIPRGKYKIEAIFEEE